MKIVEYVSFNHAFISVPVGKSKIKESEYDPSGSVNVVDQGQKLVSGRTNRLDLVRDNTPYILFGDHTRVVKFIDFPFVVGADGVRFYKANVNFDSEYLYFFLSSVQLPIDGYGRHSKYLKQTKVPNVPLAKQRRIAARLKAQLAEVEKARKAAEVQLAEITFLLDFAIEKTIKDSLPKGYRNVLLGDVVNISAKLVDPTVPDMKSLPHVSAENIVSITGELINLKSAAEDGMKSNKYFFDSGDVLYSKLRPYLRKVALPNFSGLCSADMYPLKADSDNIDSEFLKILLTSNLFTEYANEKSARSRMPKLNREQLFNWEFKLPSLKNQKACAEKLLRILEQLNKADKAAKRIVADVSILPSKLLSQSFEMN